MIEYFWRTFSVTKQNSPFCRIDLHGTEKFLATLFVYQELCTVPATKLYSDEELFRATCTKR